VLGWICLLTVSLALGGPVQWKYIRLFKSNDPAISYNRGLRILNHNRWRMASDGTAITVRRRAG
jgi:hypothetical protein